MDNSNLSGSVTLPNTRATQAKQSGNVNTQQPNSNTASSTTNTSINKASTTNPSTAQSTSNQQNTQPQVQRQPTPSTWRSTPSSGWSSGSMWGTRPSNTWGSTNTTNKPLNTEEKVAIIRKMFKEVLGREATDRDISYYKYGTVTEDYLRKRLVQTAEHKETVENGRKYKKLKEDYEKLVLKARMLETKIKDNQEEFKKLDEVLQEKNIHIKRLREELMPNAIKPDYVPTEVMQHTPSSFDATQNTNIQSNQEPATWLDKIILFIRQLFDL